MLEIQSTFSGFSVDDLEITQRFYRDTLGFELVNEVGGTRIKLPAGASAWMYAKNDHQPATYTMLDLMVNDIDEAYEAYEALTHKGVTFEHYSGSPQDEKGIMRGKKLGMGPNIAWFKDPAGNILAIVEA